MKRLIIVFTLLIFVSKGNSQSNSNCVRWTDGVPSDYETIQAANFLCSNNLINKFVDQDDLSDIVSLNDVCLMMTNVLFGLNNGTPSDDFPCLQAEIFNLPHNQQRAAKAMLFLDYGDGITSLDNDYYSYKFTEPCATQDILRVILEALDVEPYTNGYNKFDDSPSNFDCNIARNDKSYGHIYRAYRKGWLNDFTYYACDCGNSCTYSALTVGQFWILLYRILPQVNIPGPNEEDFITPNNFSIYNSNSGGSIERGIYTYNKSFYSIPTFGLPLNFEISYHSSLIDYPSLNKKSFFPDINQENLFLQRTIPLGRCWTHTYNIFIQSSIDKRGDDQFLVIRWSDGTAHVYNYKTKKYITKEVYDDLKITSKYSSGNAKKITIETKTKIKYFFERDLNNVFNLVEIKDRNNNSIELYYESGEKTPSGILSSGRVKSVSVPGTKALIEFSYQPLTNYISSVKDNTGRQILFDVEKYSENLAESVDAERKRTIYRYGKDSEQFLLNKIVLPKHNEITNSYQKRKLRQSTNNQYVVTANFNASYLASGTSTSTKITVTPQNGQRYSIDYKHDGNGKIERIKSATQDKTIYYNDIKNPTLPTKIVDDKINFSETYVYDTKGNIEKRTTKKPGVTQTQEYSYNNFNDVIWHKWANGTEINYGYDNDGNLISETGPLKYNKIYVVNSHGQIVKKENHSLITEFEYRGENGLLSKISIPNTSISISATYDKAPRLESIVNANKSIDKFSYYKTDHIKEIIKDVNGLNLETKYSYDDNWNITSIEDPRKNTTYLEYDHDTDDLLEERFGNYYKTWKYNKDGSIKSFEDKNRQEFKYNHYPEGHFAEGLIKDDGYSTYKYNKSQQLEKIEKKDDNSSLTYSYDDALRLTRVTNAPNSADRDISYAYSNSNDQIKQILVKSNPINFYYDDLNRIQSVTWQSGTNEKLIETIDYRPDGLIKAEHLGNQTSIYYNYDKAGRLDSIWSEIDSTHAILHAVGCSFDNSGNRVREFNFVNISADSLQSINQADINVTYDYDKINRIRTINNVSVTSDKNGNQLENSTDSFYNAIYDIHDNLLNCTANGIVNDFKYDPLENRLSRNDEQFVIDYINNGNILYSNVTKQYYIHSPFGLIASIDSATNKCNYYLFDFRGSTVAIIDEDQKVKESYHYDPFGIIDSSSRKPGTSTPFLFVGKLGVMYESSSLYYMRARYYAPKSGRFMSEDPFWNTNLYTYTDNNPLTNIDPNGTYIETALDIASLSYDIYDYRRNPSTLGALYLAADIVTTALPILAGGGTALRGLVSASRSTKGGGTLFHYTSEAGYKAIMESGELCHRLELKMQDMGLANI